MPASQIGCVPRRTSFRDPAGSVELRDGRVLRTIRTPEAAASALEFLQSQLCGDLMASGAMVNTWQAEEPDSSATPCLTLEHEPAWFPSYPSEWCPEMLYSAAEHTLDLFEQALSAGYTIKDATPYNVLFNGTRPVFVDFLSFERRDPTDPHWLPLAQFTRTFLLPLLAWKEFGLAPSLVFQSHRDGLEPEEITHFCSPLQRLKPALWRLATLPSLLNRYAENRQSTVYSVRTVEPERAEFTLRLVAKRARRLLKSVCPPVRSSGWSDYTKLDHARHATECKREFVLQVLREASCSSVLDIGCNTGTYSIASAGTGASVVALDSDPAVVGQLYVEASAAGLDVQPLLLNIARPTPALGWLNAEEPSFLSRAAAKFDCVLMLGLVHHLIVTERVPVPQIFQLAAHLTKDSAVVEYVPPSDPMFHRIARGRDSLHRDLTGESFEQDFSGHFDCVRKIGVPGSERVLYWLRRKR